MFSIVKDSTKWGIPKTYCVNNRVQLNIVPQNKKGKIILGKRFPKNVLILHSRPKERAPDNIKNRLTPITVQAKKEQPKIQCKLGGIV